MIVTVPSGQFNFYEGDDATIELRIYARISFVDSDGNTIVRDALGGDSFYKSVICPVAGNVATYPSFTISSTDDISPDIYYTFTLHNSDGELLGTLFQRIRIPAVTPRTMAQLVLFSAAQPVALDDTYYTADQVDALLSGIVSRIPKASDTVIGATKLSLAPISARNPIAVGNNDTRLIDNLANYSNSLSAAVTAIGVTKKVLAISAPFTLPATLDVPANITLDIQQTGLITAAAGQTLTVRSMIDPGTRQVFAGSGTVRFSKTAINELNLAWWVGADATVPTSAAVKTAIDTMIASLIYSAGGVLYIPAGFWKTDGGHILSDAMIVKGNSVFPDPRTCGTTLTLAAASAINSRKTKNKKLYIFKIGEGEHSIFFQDIVIDGNNLSTDGVLFEGAAPNTSGHMGFDRVSFANCTNGVNMNSLGGTWQLAQVRMTDCIFMSNSNAGIKWNSINSSLTLINTNFAVPAGGCCVQLSCGRSD